MKQPVAVRRGCANSRSIKRFEDLRCVAGLVVSSFLRFSGRVIQRLKHVSFWNMLDLRILSERATPETIAVETFQGVLIG